MRPWDVIIVGSGMGGATVAATLAPTGRRILVLERGNALRTSPHDRDENAIFRDGVYRNAETWLDGAGREFNPGNYYNVGGNSKFFGAVMLRYRADDFAPIRHLGGATPGWPMSYDDLARYYDKAEAFYRVRGQLGQDPTEPTHNAPYPFPPVPDEPDIVKLRARLSALGLHPSSLPLGVDIDRWLAHARTPWDAFPDTTGGKMDAETCGITSALAHKNVTLRTGCKVHKLCTAKSGKITGVTLEGGEFIGANQVVLSAGAVQSAALLLGSANEDYPKGVANRSDQVGRNFMNHNCSAVLALHPLRKNRSIYQKTLMLNDFYHSGGPDETPLGNVQLLGKISGTILQASSGLPRPICNWIAQRSVDFYAMSEDLPNPNSRVSLRGDKVVLDWQRTNWRAHELLVAKLKKLLRRAGFPVVLSRAFDRRLPSHQCGTARMGVDPDTSVVDPFGRSHDHSNLFVIDASILPTSAAVNPALTIAALAMRGAEHMGERDLAE